MNEYRINIVLPQIIDYHCQCLFDILIPKSGDETLNILNVGIKASATNSYKGDVNEETQVKFIVSTNGVKL